MEITKRSGKSIVDWRDWERPKKAYQWAPGRSSMELARAWFTSPAPVVPPEMTRLFASNPLTKGLTLTDGTPEFVTLLPERGEGRNHDLRLRGRTDQPVTVCVEAKADEPFGELVSETRKAGTDESGQPVGSSRKTQRLQALLGLLFGPNADPACPPWSELRYQLLTAAAGTVIQTARDQASLGVMVVHEFLTSKVDRSAKVAANAVDFARFVGLLAGVGEAKVHDGKLYGPVTIPRRERLPHEVQLLVGKIVYDWSKEGAAS